MISKKDLIFFRTFGIVLLSYFLGCSADSDPIPVAPPFQPEDVGSDSTSDTFEPTNNEDASSDTQENPPPEDIVTPEDLFATDAAIVEDGGASDADGDNPIIPAEDIEVGDTDIPAEDVVEEVDAPTEDIQENPPEDTETTVDTSSPQEDTTQPVEEDTGPPPECADDAECTFLTALTCCPEPQTPCVDAPDVGLFAEQLEVINWLADNCDPSLECPQLVAPECSQCHNLLSFEAICDPDIGECAVLSSLNCGALCEAAGQGQQLECPLISHPDLLTEENLADCGCP